MAEEEKKKPEGKPEGKEKKATQMVRIHATDIDGSKSLLTGVARVKGVGDSMANAILLKLNMDRKKKLVDLTDPEIATIEKAIDDPASLGIPKWMFNRRKDMDTGKDLHINTSDLTLTLKNDLDLLGETKSYRGLRHARGLKVRGQRTKSTGRGQSSVGVTRKKQQPGKS